MIWLTVMKYPYVQLTIDTFRFFSLLLTCSPMLYFQDMTYYYVLFVADMISMRVLGPVFHFL